jgi:hypothetical protein
MGYDDPKGTYNQKITITLELTLEEARKLDRTFKFLHGHLFDASVKNLPKYYRVNGAEQIDTVGELAWKAYQVGLDAIGRWPAIERPPDENDLAFAHWMAPDKPVLTSVPLPTGGSNDADK